MHLIFKAVAVYSYDNLHELMRLRHIGRKQAIAG